MNSFLLKAIFFFLFLLVSSYGIQMGPCLRALTKDFSIGMIDASGKSFNDIGKYQECMLLTPNHTYHTCIYDFIVRDQLPLKWGACVPTICNKQELLLYADIIFQKLNGSIHTLDIESVNCAKESNPPLDAGAIGAICVCGVICFLVVFGTLLDYLCSPPPSNALPLVQKAKVDEKEAAKEKEKEREREKEKEKEKERDKEGEKGVRVEHKESEPFLPLPPPPSIILNIQEEPSIAVTETTCLLNSTTTTTTTTTSSSPSSSVQQQQQQQRPPPPPSSLLSALKKFTSTHLTNPTSKAFVFFQSFSLLFNWPKVFTPVSGNTTSFNGVRTLSMLWVVLGHSVAQLKDVGFDNPLFVYTDYYKRFEFQIVGGGEFAVDTFFYIAGFLVAAIGIKEMYRSKRLNLFLYFFHRFWRLSPAYFFVLLIWFKLSPYWVTGPFWYLHSPRVQSTCGPYWWTNILYINNFYPTHFATQPCMGWSWYLSNDMQFFIFTPILLYTYYYNKKLGVALLSFLIVASWTITGTLVGVYDVSYSVFSPSQNDYLDKIYTKPYTRMAPYLIGVLVGFLYSDYEIANSDRKTRKLNPVKLPWWVLLVGYTLAAAFLLLPPYGTYTLYNGSGWKTVDNVFYITFARSAFALGVGWLTTMCFFGYGGVLKHFFEAPVFTVGARLSYSAYLIHPLLLWVGYSNQSRVFHFDYLVISYHFLSFTVLAFACALVLFLIIERPMMNLEKLFLPVH